MSKPRGFAAQYPTRNRQLSTWLFTMLVRKLEINPHKELYREWHNWNESVFVRRKRHVWHTAVHVKYH